MLLDEWPLVAGLWDRVRRASDRLGRPGRFILSASAQPSDYIIRHSGAGRMGRVVMRPMSLWESGASTGTVSLRDLADRGLEAEHRASAMRPQAPVDQLRNVIDWLLRGGWPLTQTMAARDAQEFARDYLDEVCRVDVAKASGTRHNPKACGDCSVRWLATARRRPAGRPSRRTWATAPRPARH